MKVIGIICGIVILLIMVFVMGFIMAVFQMMAENFGEEDDIISRPRSETQRTDKLNNKS